MIKEVKTPIRVLFQQPSSMLGGVTSFTENQPVEMWVTRTGVGYRVTAGPHKGTEGEIGQANIIEVIYKLSDKDEAKRLSDIELGVVRPRFF